MAKKAQIVLLVEPTLHTDIDILRIISGESRARVIEDLLSAQVYQALSQDNVRRDVRRVEKLAKKAGKTMAEYAADYAKRYAGKSYGPGLDALEREQA